MRPERRSAMRDLFDESAPHSSLSPPRKRRSRPSDGAALLDPRFRGGDNTSVSRGADPDMAPILLRGFALASQDRILAELQRITAAAPFRRMVTPGGFTMSVAMTSCGDVGWVTDR